MRCNYCQRYMHKLHKSVIEHEDGSADVCDCPRCGCAPPLTPEVLAEAVKVAKEHPERMLGQIFDDIRQTAPPPHPLPFDHGKYRIAEEPAGTNPNLPWQLTYCVECRDPVWAKNQRTIDRQEAICESDYYMMVSDHYEELGKQQTRIRNRIPNPFEL